MRVSLQCHLCHDVREGPPGDTNEAPHFSRRSCPHRKVADHGCKKLAHGVVTKSLLHDGQVRLHACRYAHDASIDLLLHKILSETRSPRVAVAATPEHEAIEGEASHRCCAGGQITPSEVFGTALPQEVTAALVPERRQRLLVKLKAEAILDEALNAQGDADDRAPDSLQVIEKALDHVIHAWASPAHERYSYTHTRNTAVQPGLAALFPYQARAGAFCGKIVN
mmetsp:Transcript_57571/g.124497  ORF Transcript_57571/g.124497 Transcript_57571/m.124497 type:complete len:224 (-) Transcript_57571:270-941(-)